jgi:ADP-heptose:LPS heptosyltransferase
LISDFAAPVVFIQILRFWSVKVVLELSQFASMFIRLFIRICRFIFRLSQHAEPLFLAAKIQRGEINRVLFIALQQLGDNLVFTPTFKTIVEHYPQAQFDMLVNSVGYEVFKNAPQIKRFYVDRAWYWGKGERKIFSLLKLIWDIRKTKYDLAVLDTSCVSLKYPVIAFLTGATYRLGVDQNGRGFLNNIVFPYETKRNFVEQNFAMLPYFNLQNPSPALILDTTIDDQRAAETLLKDIKKDNEPILIVHQGSNWGSKQWFIENWVELLELVLSRTNAKILLSGTGREAEQISEIASRLNDSSRVVSLIGKTTIHSLKELIERSDLLLTVDTGVMHIGNTTKTPMIVLMNAIDFEDRWIQASERVRVLRKEVSCKYCLSEICPLGTKECMKLISVSEVYEAMLPHLRQNFATPSGV